MVKIYSILLILFHRRTIFSDVSPWPCLGLGGYVLVNITDDIQDVRARTVGGKVDLKRGGGREGVVVRPLRPQLIERF